MRPGTKLRCVDAKEHGIPITEGETYTLKTYAADGSKRWGDGSMLHQKEPGVELTEVGGCFLLSRFEVIQ